jgi:long-chain-alcohol oxidase
MSTFSRGAADWEGSGYGALLFTPATHPGLFAAATPWVGGRDYKRLMLQYPNACVVLVLTRDSGSGARGAVAAGRPLRCGVGRRGKSAAARDALIKCAADAPCRSAAGRVVIDRSGRPRLHYSLSQRDEGAMLRGMRLGLRCMAAAGAATVMTLLNAAEGRFEFGQQGAAAGAERAEDPDFLQFLDAVQDRGVPEQEMPTFSAHQMGTARMGAPDTRMRTASAPRAAGAGVGGLGRAARRSQNRYITTHAYTLICCPAQAWTRPARWWTRSARAGSARGSTAATARCCPPPPGSTQW